MSTAPVYPTIDELRKNPAVSTFHGVRVVQCDLTGQQLTAYAAIPVPKTGKNGKSKTTFRGSFVDYETAVGYLHALVAKGQLLAEQFEAIYQAISVHLGYAPKTPNANAAFLAPFGPLTVADWHASYVSATQPGALFSIPEKKPEKEHKDRYYGYQATSENGKFRIDQSNIAFRGNRVDALLKPWADEPDHTFSFLVSIDGAKNGPNQAIIQEMPTPKAHTDVLQLKSAKNGSKVTVLKSQIVKAAKKPEVATPAAAEEEVITPAMREKRKKSVKTHAEDKPAVAAPKKRKTVAAAN